MEQSRLVIFCFNYFYGISHSAFVVFFPLNFYVVPVFFLFHFLPHLKADDEICLWIVQSHLTIHLGCHRRTKNKWPIDRFFFYFSLLLKTLMKDNDVVDFYLGISFEKKTYLNWIRYKWFCAIRDEMKSADKFSLNYNSFWPLFITQTDLFFLLAFTLIECFETLTSSWIKYNNVIIIQSIQNKRKKCVQSIYKKKCTKKILER